MNDMMDSKVSGLVSLPILQIHPSLRCNLTCKHCYSNSGLLVSDRLETARLLEVIDDAAEMGYRVLSFSGGEPFLYDELLTHAAVSCQIAGSPHQRDDQRFFPR
jgi:MoaA/NifB/PqqE/SkfB family radical SAM enzyme